MILSLIEAWCVILNPVDVRGGQSARDNIVDVIKPARCRRRTLPRGPGLSPISRDVIGLAGCLGSIIVKCRPIGVYRI